MLSGNVDRAGFTGVRGWVRDPAFPDAPVSLLITAGDKLLERVVANRYRPDVERAGFGQGKFGFDLAFAPPLGSARSWIIHIRSEADGQDIPGSPVRLAASTEFNATAQAAFVAALGTPCTEAELEKRITFLAVQRDRLLQMRADRRSVRPPRERSGTSTQTKPRALVIDQHMPKHAHDAGSNALLSHMRSLLRLGYEVSFAASDLAPRGGAALEDIGILLCGAPWFGSVEEVLRREANRFDLVYLHRVDTASAYAALVRRWQFQARLVYSVADLHHLRLARQARVEQRPALMAEARRVQAAELWAAQSADAVITHSVVEAKLLRETLPPDRVHVVAWSVTCRQPAVSFADRGGLAFIGHYGHAPNVAAALLLCHQIMPLVNAADPTIICRLVGSDLPRALAVSPSGVMAVGHVGSLDGVFDQVRLTVAPLPFGAGIKGKVLDSLASGVPCVCSSIAAEGLDLPEALAELVTDDPAKFAAAVLKLHSDGDYNAKMAAIGSTFIAERFSEAALDRAMHVVRPASPVEQS